MAAMNGAATPVRQAGAILARMLVGNRWRFIDG
jgi:hypothetical protein